MRDLPTRPLRTAAVAVGLAGLFSPAAWAHHWRLETATLPAPFLREGRVDVVIEPSGVAPIGDGRRVLVAHDNSATLHVVDVATGTLVGEPLGSPNFPEATAIGPKWAGMTRDSEGNYYLVGSQSGKSDEEPDACSAVVRFRLRAGETSAIDVASVVRWDIARPLAAAPRRRARPGADRETEGRGAGDPRFRRPPRACHRPQCPGRQGPRRRRRHHQCAFARRRARAPPPVHVRRRPLRGRRRAAHVARVRPRDERVSCPHRDGRRRPRVPRQHPLARRRRRDAHGAPVRDV